MAVEVHATLNGDLQEQAWKLYRLSFDSLRTIAVQRHVMYEDEFDAVMADPRVQKFLERDEEGELRGISTMTNHLPAMPLISPEYFAERWPERYAADRIYYIGFLGVHPHAHGTGSFGDLVKVMTGVVADVDGLAVIDVCSHNKDRLHLPRAIRWLASTWASHVDMTSLDAQTYVAYDFARTG